MFRKTPSIIAAVGVLFAVRTLGCSPEFEFPEREAAGGATNSMGGSLATTTSAGQGGEILGQGGAAGADPSTTDVPGGGSGGGRDRPYDTGEEDCSNGVDDDMDGAADCQDDKCQPYYHCLPPVPAGWQGPVALWEGEDNGLPGCSGSGYYPAGLNVVGTRVLSEPEPSSCPTCTCEPPEGATCSTVDVSYYTTPDCSGDATVVTAGETCSSEDIPHDADQRPQSARFSAPVAGGGEACVPVETGSRSTPAAQRVRARACGTLSLDGVGCEQDQLCLPTPLTPFNAAICIFIEGEADCPAGYDTKTEPYFASADDSRSCLRCSCLSPRCTGAVSDHVDDSECAGGSTEIADGECMAIEADDTDPDTRSLSWDVSAGATCTPRQGPTGSYTLSDPLTYCCAQY